MMTEDDAKTKWCPFVRASYYSGSTPASPAEQGFLGNRDVNFGHLPNTECIGSACMAWRWAEAESAAEFNKMVATGEARRPLGYCGLAGRPE